MNEYNNDNVFAQNFDVLFIATGIELNALVFL